MRLLSMLVWLVASCTTIKPLDDRPPERWQNAKKVKSPAKPIARRFNLSNARSNASNQSKKHLSKNDPCLHGIETVAAPLAELRPYLQVKLVRSSAYRVSFLSKISCSGSLRASTMSSLEAFKNSVKPKIGVILPNKGDQARVVAGVEEGMQQAFKHRKIDYPKVVILKKVDNKEQALKALAHLIFVDEVAMVIAGLDTPIANAVVNKMAGIGIASLILHKDPNLIKDNPDAFIVYPNEYDLADTLVDEARRRGIKKVTVLRPNTGKSNALLNYFAYCTRQQKITIEQDIAYTPGDYESMSYAIEKLTHTQKSERSDEYQGLLDRAKATAKAKGTPFDARQVILPPKIASDAVFIPDHFRMLRYFVKLLHYQQVEKITLLGAQEWRSSDLVAPWDPLLGNAFFVDYIGNYRRLPIKVPQSSLISDYFINDDDIVAVDFSLIGYRTASIALNAFLNKKNASKTLSERLSLSQDPSGTFGVDRDFYANRISRWPTYIFSPYNSGINLISRKIDRPQAKAHRLLVTPKI